VAIGSVAAPAAAGTPLDECYGRAAAREDIGACLDRMMEQARAELVDVVLRTRAQARHEAAAGSPRGAPGSPAAAGRFERSQRLFWSYRQAHCEWLREAALPALDAAEQHTDCMVRLTRERSAELRARLPAR
jgi:uncharacterized protein YecT (DUF1311 family)